MAKSDSGISLHCINEPSKEALENFWNLWAHAADRIAREDLAEEQLQKRQQQKQEA